jgi:hypothetical protein
LVGPLKRIRERERKGEARRRDRQKEGWRRASRHRTVNGGGEGDGRREGEGREKGGRREGEEKGGRRDGEGGRREEGGRESRILTTREASTAIQPKWTSSILSNCFETA